MKKNKMMRTAAGLLVAVLLTTCVISGTFAKYTTRAAGSDTARVAKFGVTIAANGSMFSQYYEDKDGGNRIAAIAQGSVDSSNTDKVLAPGTSGAMTGMTLSGTPEVRVQVTYTGTVTLNGNWKAKQSETAAESYYCPLKVTVGDTTFYGLDYSSEADFKAAIEGKINAATAKTYDAGTDLANIPAASAPAPTISWEWAFEGADGTAVHRTDYADTYLGNAGNKGNITIAVTTTVTQVD